MIREQVMRSTRLSGQVMRYHTWPTLTQQSTGEHSWQVLRIYTEMFGPPSSAVAVYILYHDSGELHTGDLPFPAKRNSSVLKEECTRIEEAAIRKMTGGSMPELTREEGLKVKICDLVEMNEFGAHEVRLGNQYAVPIVEDTLEIANNAHGIGAEDAFLDYIRRRPA